MTFQELRETVMDQMNLLRQLNPAPVTTAFLYAVGNPQNADSTAQETSALEFAESLILCLDEDAASKLLRQDQERVRRFFLVSQTEYEKR